MNDKVKRFLLTLFLGWIGSFIINNYSLKPKGYTSRTGVYLLTGFLGIYHLVAAFSNLTFEPTRKHNIGYKKDKEVESEAHSSAVASKSCEDTNSYFEMKRKADNGTAEDSYNFAIRLKEDNCKRGAPKTLDENIEYFTEIIQYLENAANVLPAAKLELANSYLEIAEAYRLMKNRAAFIENAEKGMMWFEQALLTGKFDDYKEDYETIKKNIAQIKTELK